MLVSFPGRLRLLLALCAGGGNECVDYVNYLSSVDCLGAVGYIVYRALSMVRRLISLVFSAVACFLPVRPVGVSPPHAPVFFPFFGTAGAIFYLSQLSSQYLPVGLLACRPIPIAIEWR